MFFLDNHYDKIAQNIENKTVKEAEFTSGRIKLVFDDSSELTVNYAEHEGLDIMLCKSE